MGRSIHFHSEVKINGVWHHHSEHHIKRHYALFAKMANVRNYKNKIKPISNPKGLPTDISFLTKLSSDSLGSDGHSHSWLNSEEISELHKFIVDEDNSSMWFGIDGWEFEHSYFPYFLGNHLNSFYDEPKHLRQYGVEDVRYVFWFDN